MFDGWITGMESVVDRLNALGVAQYALTNLPAEKWSHIEETYPKIANFDAVVVSGAEKMVKPDPRLYQLTIARIRHAPEDVLFIDDREDNVRAGIEAGFKGHVFKGADGAVTALKDHGFAI
jgi:HAD superfamily hydrolase (TIGR01509 family)